MTMKYKVVQTTYPIYPNGVLKKEQCNIIVYNSKTNDINAAYRVLADLSFKFKDYDFIIKELE